MPADPLKRAQRCAIYTRKSTDDRFDRDFNSIESQLDICSAYITCQQHKDWLQADSQYNDPGQSGGDLNRPALQRLMHDIELGRIDVVVIYKIDRLTRSLADFIRLIEVLDRYQVSFVSVTQSFDTSDAMGRLVLNILLTFAQFERELIADRIRDKVAAMKRRGKYAGGTPPYGYDVVDRRLIINQAEAEKVREIYSRYLEIGSYSKLCRQMKAEGLKSKQWVSRSGKVCGGKLASSGLVYHILGSPLYAGRVPHNDTSYPGEHQAIVDEDTWNAAQELRHSRRRLAARSGGNFLRDIFHDSYGRRMVITNNLKDGVRYRYYVSEQSRWATREGVKRYRVRAEQFEELVLAATREVVSDRELVRAAAIDIGRRGHALDTLPAQARLATALLATSSPERLHEILSAILVEGETSQDRLILTFRSAELIRFISWDGIGIFEGNRAAWTTSEPTFTVQRPLNEIRFERALVMPVEPIPVERRGRASPGLVDLLSSARTAQELVDSEADTPVEALAARFGWSPSFFCRVLRLNYLAPDIAAAIRTGAHPKGLTRARQTRGALPLDWDLQRQLFGFPARPDHKMYAPRDSAERFSETGTNPGLPGRCFAKSPVESA